MANGQSSRTVPKSRVCFFRTTPQNWAKLESIYKRTGATPSEQLRRGLALWLKQQEAGR